MNGCVNRINLNRRHHIKTRLLKAQTQPARPRKQINTNRSFFSQMPYLCHPRTDLNIKHFIASTGIVCKTEWRRVAIAKPRQFKLCRNKNRASLIGDRVTMTDKILVGR